VEVTFSDVIEFAVENHLEAADSVLDRNVFAGRTGEHFGDVERLREETLDLAGAVNGELVLRGEFIETENRDDILQILVALEHALALTGDLVVLLADNGRLKGLRHGSERI